MKSQVLSNWDIPWLPSFALIIFFTIIALRLFIVTRKEAKLIYSDISKIPLDEGESND